MLRKKKQRMSQEINAGSMADIAFLLLIFFLVTTTINAEKGIPVKLPPWSDEPPEMTKLKERNVYSVFVNYLDQVQVRGELMEPKDIREDAKKFIGNPEGLDNLAESPANAIISLKNDRGTKYETYLKIYNELKAAYNELWEAESQKRFSKPYGELERAQQKEIQVDIPLVISEAEPEDNAG